MNLNSMLASRKEQEITPLASILSPAAQPRAIVPVGQEDRMFQAQQDVFTEAQLKARLYEVIGDCDAGNGTPAVDAIVSALSVDLRLSGVGEDGFQRLLDLTDAEIVNLAVNVTRALKTSHAAFSLPLGSEVKVSEPGGLRIGREQWVLDASRPGLYAMEIVRRDAHGPNLELLHRHITRLTARLACRRIELPQPVHIVDNDSRHILQFAPFEPAGGVALQHVTADTGAERFCSALPSQIKALAERIVGEMRLLWTHRREIGARAQQLRCVAEAAAAEIDGTGVRTVAIDLSDYRDGDAFPMYVELTGLDEALRPGVLLDYVPGDHDLDARSVRQLAVHEYRTEERCLLQDKGADGRISALASALFQIAPEGAAAVLERLATELEAAITIPHKVAPI